MVTPSYKRKVRRNEVVQTSLSSNFESVRGPSGLIKLSEPEALKPTSTPTDDFSQPIIRHIEISKSHANLLVCKPPKKLIKRDASQKILRNGLLYGREFFDTSSP